MKITNKTKICMIIGDPVEHSLSPQMHNAAYEKLGIDDEYVYIKSHVKTSDLKLVFDGIRTLRIRGLSVTLPHKEDVINHLDHVDVIAQKIGAVNTIVNEQNQLIGYNTDWLGIINPLEQVINIENKTVALLGAGGTARAIAYGVTKRGGKLKIYNRTLENAEKLATIFNSESGSIDDFENISNSDIIINSTTIGLNTNNESPLPSKYIKKNHIIFDAVYSPNSTTRFTFDAQSAGATTISGKEMLLHQGLAQFKLFTGFDAPVETMRKALEKNNS